MSDTKVDHVVIPGTFDPVTYGHHEVGARGVVKGLRAMTDFEYELQQADLNSHMAPDLESIFVMSSPEYGYVSSSIVREMASLGADVSFLVPNVVSERLRERFGM